MAFKQAISPAKKAYLLYAFNDKGMKWHAICRKLNISKTSLYRLRKIWLKGEERPKKGTKPRGRPRKLNERDVRSLRRCVRQLRKEQGNFSSSDLMKMAGIERKHICNRTVTKYLNEAGYKFLQARKKGVLTVRDTKKRNIFARNTKRNYPKELWTDKINFYLDGVSFCYKRNPMEQARSPRGRIWRKPGEGLTLCCTAKGSKEGSGGKLVHLLVAITYKKGVIDCEQYEKMNGKYFQSYVKRKFPQMFEMADKAPSRLWIQDGDPSQNCAAAKASFVELNAQLLSIPPRSPDINPIENLFHLVRKELRKQAIREDIRQESYEEFSSRVIDTIKSTSVDVINKIIDTMDHRMDLIIQNNGNRTKY